MADVAVHLACNDDRGHFAGEVSSIQLCAKGDCTLTITVFESFKLRLEPKRLSVTDPESGASLVLRTLSTAPLRWQGNVVWDAVLMALPEASKLARFCVEHGFWLEEWSSEGPLAALVAELDAIERRARDDMNSPGGGRSPLAPRRLG